MEQEMMVYGQALEAPMPLELAKQHQRQLNNFVASQMKEGVDYGLIPGLKKKSLWKPGAEKLLYFNGLGCRLEPGPNTVIDWKLPFFNYEYKAVVYSRKTGKVVAESFGSCNSRESKYRYLWLTEAKLPRGINKSELDIEQRQAQSGGNFTVYKTENPDIFSLVNTLQKMAQKRAFIGATLMATRASENFTQDVEEEEGEAVSTNAPVAQTKNPVTFQQNDLAFIEDVKAIFATAKKAGISDAAFKTYIVNTFKYTVIAEGQFDSSLLMNKDIPVIMDWIKKQPK